MGQTVRGTTAKGVRLTHTPSKLPSNAPPEPGLGTGPGATPGNQGAENVHGSAGNAQLSGTNNPGTHSLPAAGKTPTSQRSPTG